MTPRGITDLKALLTGMEPHLSRRQWCFEPMPEAKCLPETAFAMIREDEGLCCIVPAQEADEGAARFARITLKVHSDLEAVGLTAAVSAALASKGIACNVVAGLYHDHIFVSWDRRKEALELLEALRPR